MAEAAGISLGSLSRLIDKMVKLQLISVTHIPGGSRILVKGYTVFTWIQESKETQKNTPSTDAAVQMAEAERNMGGRSMQDSTNLPN
ncbi:DNA-binding transcriptional regulator GbsR (MarR family) [Parabacteroides faecis]|uniref:DNA-binding transcriptional regulator GbsR (MarR family) n=1 Tax=Parabacteroides faecis TaxID=1217282 RepID=A0ABR6KHX1_9BACT|nr:DNA-binding transcriptional regulator GbsR (MarR family) [Parabacteroides faecis]